MANLHIGKYHLILVEIGNIDSTDISLDTLLQGYNYNVFTILCFSMICRGPDTPDTRYLEI